MIKYEKVVNINKLVTLSSLIWHEYWKDFLSEAQIEYMIKKFQSEDAIKHQMDFEHYTYYYIYYNRELIGYIGLALREGSIFLSKFYIKKDYRHKGIGTKTFGFIKEAARAQHKNKITLTVNKHNTNSINAYKKWGFKTVDAVVTDIGGGFVMDDYIMEYDL